MGLILGGVLLDGFDALAGVGFGGKQSLAVHTLPGGVRIVDAMGQDDAEITWHGYLTGTDAVTRARALDMMRAVGAPLPLSWDAFCYSVVISGLTLSYLNPYWVSYNIQCLVLTEQVSQAALVAPAVTAAILGDLQIAGGWINTGVASSAVQATGALTPGTQTNAAAAAALIALEASVTGSIATAGAVLSRASVADLAGAAGSLAQLAAASGFIARAAANLAGGQA